MKIFVRSLLFLVVGFAVVQARAFTDHGAYVGVGYFSENAFWKETQTTTGEKSWLGATSFPIMMKYDWQFMSGIFVSPTISYTPLGRSELGDAAKVTILHLVFPFGMNFGMSNWDWSVGPGIMRRNIQGSGGTEQLSNGNSVSTFARPGRSVALTNITLNFGGSYLIGHSRLALDVVSEGLLSSKRSFSLMFSYCYQFSGGLL